MKRVESWLIVTCPMCLRPAGQRCIETGERRSLLGIYQHADRNRNGAKLHRIWELAGAEPMREEECKYARYS